ncbi:MAG: dTDP-4-dehydrorhamnose reductase [Gracilibacteraceae bacterium]|jgi:dTDP-4-dehydrorhamnose reductase|nr:dTDP-4-dehydrorhamnose reductase [Gracilibacteraceae bacterium]
MKFLVTGAGGQLGSDVCAELARRGLVWRGVGTADFDVTDEKAVRAYMEDFSPGAVVHCAAYTAVDAAEDDGARCRAVNTDGTRHIAEACAALGAKMVYISTDYVFPGRGDSFYETDDPPEPLSVYGRAKLGGERAMREILARSFVVRISWVFGAGGPNFVKTMLRLGAERAEISVVSDQFGSPTYTADLAPLLCDLALSEKYGVYHATNEGICSWAEFAVAIMLEAGLPARVVPVSSGEYPARAPRPFNSRLSKDSLTRAGFARLPHWRDALRRYLRESTLREEMLP